ncbi:MAG TPA: VOC family protein [Vicinamibacterales bacterium]|jgi:PhnB protein
MAVKAIPDGYYSLTPYLVCKDAAKAIDYYTQAFGAVEYTRMPGPGGRIMHAEVKIGNSMLMLSDENPERGAVAPSGSGRSASLMFYTDDVDAVFKRAVDLGATSIENPTDMFWGDRMGNLRDPFGHQWAIATHKEDVSPEEMQKRMQAIGT